MTFPYLICFILFDINLLVAARNFASANFRKSGILFVLLKYRAIFPWNCTWNIVWQWNFSHKIFARKFARTKTEIRWISFALLLHNTVNVDLAAVTNVPRFYLLDQWCWLFLKFSLKVTSHTWQSMRDHYIKVLYKRREPKNKSQLLFKTKKEKSTDILKEKMLNPPASKCLVPNESIFDNIFGLQSSAYNSIILLKKINLSFYNLHKTWNWQHLFVRVEPSYAAVH